MVNEDEVVGKNISVVVVWRVVTKVEVAVFVDVLLLVDVVSMPKFVVIVHVTRHFEIKWL